MRLSWAVQIRLTTGFDLMLRLMKTATSRSTAITASALPTGSVSAASSSSYAAAVAVNDDYEQEDGGDEEHKQAGAQVLLRRAISERSTCRFFASDPIPDATLAEVLRLTQVMDDSVVDTTKLFSVRAPTALNTQPYACVVVREQADREKLVDGMLAANGRKVKEAPVVVVFAADLKPSNRLPQIQKLMTENDSNPEEVKNLPNIVPLFSGEGCLSGVRSLLFTAASPFRAVPVSVPTTAWSYKQTVFAASTFVYAAQASGLSTCIMEGFDERRIKKALSIPGRYSIPVMICCGYPKPEMQRKDHQTPRLAPTEIFYDGKFGQSSATLFE